MKILIVVILTVLTLLISSCVPLKNYEKVNKMIKSYDKKITKLEQQRTALLKEKTILSDSLYKLSSDD